MWTARTLWATNLISVIVYALVAAHFIGTGAPIAPWVVGLPMLYLGVLLVLCASYFALAWFWRARRPRDARIPWRGTLRLLWLEYLTLLGAAPRMMLYRSLVPDPAPAPVATPVLLVHGVLCNAGVWRRLAQFLAARGIPGVYALSYGPPLASIETFADQLADKIDAVLAATGARRLMIVSHSMGGLVTRACIRKHGVDKLSRVLTIGAPHHGSVHAWFCCGASLAQMRPGNAWLAALNRERLDPSLRFVSLWSWHDSMVAPQTSSELAGAIDVAMVGVGHNALLADPEVFGRVLAEIEDEAKSVTSEFPA